MDNLFSTHPDTDNRIAALQEIARTMPRPSAARSGFVEGVRLEDLGQAPAGRRPGGPWGSRRGPWG
jgi:heat shock protein HtpX